MQNIDPVAALLNYDHWCTDQIAAKMEPLSPEQLRREFPIGWHTLHKTLYHIVTVAEHWTDRSRPDPTGLFGGANDPNPDAIPVTVLRQRYQAAGRQMLASLASLMSVAESERDVGWLIRRNHLIHLTTHAMHHRAQLIFMLTQLGIPDIIEGGDFGGWANGPLKASTDRKSIARHL
jgi:uncharacterized damage-inducible protein DinB